MKRFLSLILAMAIIASVFVAVPVQAANNSYREWKQYSGYWKSYKLGGSSCTMKSSGCTTTALAMAAVKLGCESESSFDPGVFLTRMNNAGGYNGYGAIKWEKISKAVPNMSMVGSEIKFSTESNSTRIAKISEKLNNGYAVLITILRYTDAKGKHWHYVLADSVNNGTLNILDPGYANGNGDITAKYGSAEIMIRSIRVFKNNGSEKYKKAITLPAETHTCSYSVSTESSHPHNKYNICNCGKKVYLGKDTVSSCSSCYPVGNVNLTRSFEKTKGTATFYRNTVSNADSYTLKLYKNNSLYNTYTMNNSTYYVSGLPSGNYYAVLYARNSSTGEERRSSCDSFKIVDTYTVSYNANGGSNAPSSQTKIEDTPLTVTSSIPQKEGYVFKGWAKSKNAVTPQYLSGDSYETNANTTFYAVWEPEVYTVTFDANGGTGTLESKTITYGNTMKMPNSVIKEYAYLIGWSTDKNATKAEYALGVDYKVKGNLTLYAVWGNATWSNEVSNGLQGSGTEAEPYLISTAADLAYLANKVNTQTATPTYEYYKMTDNINLTYNEWVPIGIYGNENQYFYGSFDGNGYTISDLYITQPNQNYVGLFGYAKDSNIKNLTVTGAIESITADNAFHLGGIVGYTNNVNLNGLSAKYFNIGGITANSGTSSVGTIAGKTENGKIERCISEDCSINLKSGQYNAGMIAGYCTSDMADCDVISTDEGLFSAASSVNNSYIGGICGQLLKTAERCSVNAPYFSNNLKTKSSRIGGFSRKLDGEVKVCSVKFTDGDKNSITVDGSSTVYVGGFSGESRNNAKITDCKFDGKTVSVSTSSGSTYVGGLLGYAYAKTTPTVSVNGGQSLSFASLPKKDGFKATWYTDPDYKTPYDFSQVVTSNITLYAKWEKGDDTPEIWDGTSKEPAYNAETKTYTITNGEELAWVSDVTNGVITSGTNFPTDITFSGYIIELANDIYLNDVSDWKNWETTPPKNNWKPIGTLSWSSSTEFDGIFKGNNFTVFGLYDNRTNGLSSGLFGNNGGYINNVRVSHSFSENTYSGGIAGNNWSYVINCVCTKSKIKGTYAGGIVGINSNYPATIEYCVNESQVDGTSYAGGIVGSNGQEFVEDGHGVVRYCYNEGNVTGESHAGGIAGLSTGRTYNCNNNAKIIATNAYGCAGGIVGELSGYTYSNSRIENCSNNAYVYGDGYVGGIVGYLWSACVKYCYNSGFLRTYSTSSATYLGMISGLNTGKSDRYACIYYCYTSNIYHDLYNNLDNYINISNVSMKNLSNLSNLTGFSNSNWAIDTNLDIYNPYIIKLYDNYKTYGVTAVLEEDNSYINRTFANVDGDISGSGSSYSYVGGILGNGYDSSSGSSGVRNVVGMADNVSATTSGSSYKAYSGNVVGYNSANKFSFENVYYNSEMNVTSSTSNIDTTGTPRSQKTMNASFYTNLLGLTPYSSLKNLESDDKAVWVLKNGELPELYYNCLNDITVSDDIENGTITIDKTQAIDGEVVTVTATPNEGYVLNKIYVNGAEKDGTTFIVSGDSEVFATFSEKIAEYSVAVTASENASATVANVDSAEPMPMSMGENGSQTTALTAKDGEEILVTANADEDYTVDTIYVNGEEIAGDSFILTDNTTVTMDVTSISTELRAITDDAEDVGSYFAIVGGSISDAGEETVKYIRYWSADDTQTVYTTEPETGIGTYTAELMDLNASTTYYYQMTEQGEVKSFTTEEEIIPVLEDNENKEEGDGYVGDEDGGHDDGEDDGDSGTSTSSITTTTYKTLASTYKFSIECSRALTTEFLAIACYDNAGNLLTLSQIKCDGDTSYTASVPIDANIDYAKIFVWRGLSDMKPLADTEIVEITKK